jgi:hypothetical protein
MARRSGSARNKGLRELNFSWETVRKDGGFSNPTKFLMKIHSYGVSKRNYMKDIVIAGDENDFTNFRIIGSNWKIIIMGV